MPLNDNVGAVELLTHVEDIDWVTLYAGRLSADEAVRVQRIVRRPLIALPYFLSDIDRYRQRLRHIARINGIVGVPGTGPLIIAPSATAAVAGGVPLSEIQSSVLFSKHRHHQQRKKSASSGGRSSKAEKERGTGRKKRESPTAASRSSASSATSQQSQQQQQQQQDGGEDEKVKEKGKEDE